mgnify:CR=1 FL=1
MKPTTLLADSERILIFTFRPPSIVVIFPALVHGISFPREKIFFVEPKEGGNVT